MADRAVGLYQEDRRSDRTAELQREAEGQEEAQGLDRSS